MASLPGCCELVLPLHGCYCTSGWDVFHTTLKVSRLVYLAFLQQLLVSSWASFTLSSLKDCLGFRLLRMMNGWKKSTSQLLGRCRVLGEYL